MTSQPIRLRLHGEEVVLAAIPTRVDVRAQVAWIERHCDRGALEDAFGAEGTAEQLAVELAMGVTTLVRIPDPERSLDEPKVSDLSDLIDPTVRDNVQAWISWTCVGALGESYAGARFRVRLPHGRSITGELDGRSSFRVDDLTEGGTCHVELASDARPNQSASPPRGSPPQPGERTLRLGRSVGLTTDRDHLLVIALSDDTDLPGFAPGVFPEPTDLSGDRELVFHVVSADGLPLTASWSVADTAAEHAGDLVQEAQVRQKVHGKTLQLQLDALQLEVPPPGEADA